MLQPMADPSQPWEEITMDFIVELLENGRSRVIWTMVNLFSKQAHFIVFPKLPSAQNLAKLFAQHIYQLHGVPKYTSAMGGLQFTAKFWQEFLKLIGSFQGLSSRFHPSTNGAVD